MYRFCSRSSTIRMRGVWFSGILFRDVFLRSKSRPVEPVEEWPGRESPRHFLFANDTRPQLLQLLFLRVRQHLRSVNKDLEHARRGILSDAAEDVHTADVRHQEVEDDRIGRFLANQAESLGAVARLGDVEPRAVENLAYDVPRHLVVIDDEQLPQSCMAGQSPQFSQQDITRDWLLQENISSFGHGALSLVMRAGQNDRNRR